MCSKVHTQYDSNLCVKDYVMREIHKYNNKDT